MSMSVLKSLRMRRKKNLPAEPVPQVETYPHVELVSWMPKDGSRNFGDHLSSIVVSAMLARRHLSLEDQVVRRTRLLAIGSVMHFAKNGDTVWGSGVNGKMPLDLLTARDLDFRSVRGPKSAALLRERGHIVPDIFGDPALLVPKLFGQRFAPNPKQDWIFVPNLHDIAGVTDDIPFVSPLLGWNHCISRILEAKFVVASSLHGIIIAEAFGIPARFVRLSETESPFKYDDYAQGTGRAELTPAPSIQAALDMGGHPPIQFDADALMAAFPYDLWDQADN